MSTEWLLWSLLFGSIGIGYLIYGRKQRSVVPFVCGLGLLGMPYLVGELWWLIGLSLVLIALPRFVQL